MSEARKCDRCGKLYPRAKGNVSLSYNIDSDSKGSRWGFFGEGEEYDMCPACGKGFLEYVQHKRRAS